MVMAVFVFGLVAIDPAIVLVTTAYIYAASGPAYELWTWIRRRKAA